MPNTLNELLLAAAEALTNRDGYALERLRQRVCDWLQTAEETEAQLAVLDAMIVAAYLMEE